MLREPNAFRFLKITTNDLGDTVAHFNNPQAGMPYIGDGREADTLVYNTESLKTTIVNLQRELTNYPASHEIRARLVEMRSAANQMNLDI